MEKRALIIKRIIAVLCFTLILGFSLFKTYEVLKWKDTTGDYLSSMEQLYQTKDDLIDVVFVGSSHVYCGVYPCFLWEKHGIAAFDMAVSGQDKDSSYHHLKELLKTQSPKLVFVDMYGLTFDEHKIEGNIYRNLLSMKTSLNSYGLVKDYIGKKDINDYLIRWPIIHTRYKELKKHDFVEFIPNTFGRGEGIDFQISEEKPPLGKDDPFMPEELSEKNRKWLESLYELSKKEGFELCFFVTPFFNTNQRLMDAACEFANDHGIKFLDFNRDADLIGIDYSADFADSLHLNATGARKLSEYLADFCLSIADLPDHRGDAAFWQWDADLEFFYKEKARTDMERAPSLGAFMDLVKDNTDYTTVISIEYEVSGSPIDYHSYLEPYGVSKESCFSGGKWILKNGTLEKVFENTVSVDAYIKELSDLDTLSIKYVSDGFPENVLINTVSYSNEGNYVSVLVYDEKLKRVVIHTFF